MSKIYTKHGDRGETSLVGGERVQKDNLRIEVYGEIDELNSYVGLLRSELNEIFESEKKDLLIIQNWLFDLGSNLATLPEKREDFKLPKLTEENTRWLEKKIDGHDESLEELKNFILPGSGRPNSIAHICRTKTRLIERRMISLQEANNNYIKFLNRLSDYFFILARVISLKLEEKEIEWTKEVIS
jgi:cob(I)alamin adenosyltransferase